MSFLTIAAEAGRETRIHSLRIAHLLFGGVAAAVMLLAAGAATGYWLGAQAPERTPPLAAVPSPGTAVRNAAPAALPFALEQIGTISARMSTLESQAAQLHKRIGTLFPAGRAVPQPSRETSRSASPFDAAATPASLPARPDTASGRAGTGGPLLEPRAPSSALPAHDAALGLGSLTAQLARLEQQIESLASATQQRSVELMRMPSRAPIEGAAMVSGFGNRTDPFAQRHAFHAGLDFAAGHGTPIRSAAGGTVGFAGFRPDFGWLVEIDHGNGLKTRYAHASKLLVSAGTIVAPGERIAMVGSTGRSTGPHLHFEVLRGGEPVDPKRYLARL